jgi:Histidine kinase-, DNA gyrase B-, and HSP90-like ATPase
MLHDFISSNRDELISCTRAKVSARPWPPVSPDELENGVPLFLTQLSETLRLETTAVPFSPTAIGAGAVKHGRDLLAMGFTISQVVHDYGEVCQAFGDRRGTDRSGLGLGLAISRKAVTASGGEVHARNLPGKGCVFTIELPQASPAAT